MHSRITFDYRLMYLHIEASPPPRTHFIHAPHTRTHTNTHAYIYIYIYVYIFIRRQICFVLSELISVARHTRFP